MFIFRRVVTLLPDWAWIAALLFSLLIAFLISSFIELMIEKSTHNGMKQYIERFLGIGCVCFFIFLGSIDFYIYFFPKETHTYYTHCEITTPGPSSGRSGGHCKAGIKIKDKFTNKNFFLCFSSEKQPEYKLQALVKVQSNALGSYLVDYSLTKK
ncbi:hypothetical protein RHO14_06140 [Orbus wheelerorum]|uniref:hypothetical protein n=1 Tax=Orbus wheelerorum TaxID=3074111 RepID=UPI00370DB3DB